jgi:hypothetical protein
VKYTTFTLENCWSHDNWNDGYSDHEGCEGFINGGLFEYNCIGGQGAGITPAYGAHDTIIAAICQNNKIGVRYTNGGGTTIGSMTVNSVVSRNNISDGFAAATSYDYVTFINCVAYNNTEKGFANYGATKFTCINCKSIDNGTAFYGDIVSI